MSEPKEKKQSAKKNPPKQSPPTAVDKPKEANEHLDTLSLEELDEAMEAAHALNDWDTYQRLRTAKQNKSREMGAIEYRTARTYAKERGLILKQFSDVHYQLIYEGFVNRGKGQRRVKWIYNLYPGNGRIWKDRKNNGPFLNAPDGWTLKGMIDLLAEHLTAIGVFCV